MMELLGMLVVAFAGGWAFTPLVALVLGKTLPKSVRTTIGGWLFTVANLGLDGGVLTRTRNGIYEMQRKPFLGPKDRWSRLGKAPFALSYEKAEEVFGHDLINLESDSHVGEPVADGGYRLLNGSRGEFGAFVPTADDAYHVATASLQRLRGAGGVKEAMAAQEHAMKEHGGGTETSTKMMVAGMIAMLICGLGSGWLVFLG